MSSTTPRHEGAEAPAGAAGERRAKAPPAMKEVRTDIEIEAPVEVVWEVLTDFPRHAEWNPFVKQIEGSLTPGEKLTVTLQPGVGRARTVHPKVLCVDPGKSLVWESHHCIPWLVQAMHCFELQPLGERRTRFVHRELFSGWLASVVARHAAANRGAFEEMNRAIKVAAEWMARPDRSQKRPVAG